MIDVVLRCRNDIALLPSTIAGLRKQTVPLRLHAFDNGSTDGSRELLEREADFVYCVPAGSYVPGQVLNGAMSETSGPVVAFLNSDCEPLDSKWLENLVGAMSNPRVAAAFGRQMPRPGCLPWFARDTEDTFGEGKEQARWKHCFSMASSIVRRSVWEGMPFSEDVQYSEDIEWTFRARNAGYEIAYVADSRVYHSHNYSWRQYYRRQYGEGRADAQIFEWDRFGRSWLRYSLLPFARQAVRDVEYCVRHGQPTAALASPYVRLAQLFGRRKGFLEGLAEKVRR